MGTLLESSSVVLHALRDGWWMTPGEIAQDSGLAPSVVRQALAELAWEELVERGGWGESRRAGEWRITDAGIARSLADREVARP